MKVPAPWITLSLTAGTAFCAAYFLKQQQRAPGDTSARPSLTSIIADAAPERAATAPSVPNESADAAAPAAGVLRDPCLREALAMPDLAAALAHIMAREGEDHCADTRLICLVEQLPAARLGELSAALQKHPGNEFIVRFVLGAWAQRDAGGALAWVQAHSDLNSSGLRAFVSGWMRASPENALAWLDARPDSAASAGLRTAVVESMAETNPAAALELMKSRGWITNSPDALLKLMHNWGGADPQAALEGLRSVAAASGFAPLKDYPSANGTVRRADQSFSTLLRSMLKGACDRNPAEAAALLSSLTPDEFEAGHHAFASEVLARDPAVAESFFTAQPDERTRSLLKSIAQENGTMAVRFLNRITDPELQQQLLMAAMSGVGGGDPTRVSPEARATVKTVLEGITDASQRFRNTAKICQDNAATSPQWAVEMWRSMPPDARNTYDAVYFKGLAKGAPDLALSEYRQSTPDQQSRVLQVLCMNLADSRPAEALELVMQSAATEAQSKSAATLFAFWTKSDPGAALAALESHAPQLNLDAISQNLKQAGLIRTPDGMESRSVNTDELADRLKKLTEASRSTTAP